MGDQLYDSKKVLVFLSMEVGGGQILVATETIDQNGRRDAAAVT